MEPIKEEGYFKNRRGLRVFWRVWSPPDQDPAAYAVIAHGLGEHSLRYAELAEFLCGRGYRVGCLDFYGFGKSEGRRGDVQNIYDYMEDIKILQRRMNPGDASGYSHRMIVGHSFGGLIALALLERHPADYSHAVIFSPGLNPGRNVPKTLRMLARLFAVVYPVLPFNNRIHAEQISSDTEAQQMYREDPLVHSRITPRFFRQFLTLGEHVKRNGALLSSLLHIVFFHGTDDSLTSPEDTKAFYDSIASERKTFILMPEMRHDTLHESGKVDTYRRLDEWMSSHTK
jgi:acylglycerol lipase